jgi:hypothetical protein
MLTRLTTPGSSVQILSDAIWEKPTAYRRAYAGTASRGVALGTARISRLAQVPIVPMALAWGDKPRTVVLCAGDLIEPPAMADKPADITTINKVLDFHERFVGRFPEQYDSPVGFERHWDPATQRWVGP